MEGEVKQPRPKLFVGGVKRTTTGEELEKHFQQYGQVKDAFIVYCKQTSRSRGFGFVEFEDPSAAGDALKDHHTILGQKVDVHEAQLKKTVTSETAARGEGECHKKCKRVFVGGLPSTITLEEFRSSFESYGAVSNAIVVYDKHSGQPRGFGFITFGSEDSADKSLKNRFHQLNGSLVEVKRANHRHNNTYNNYARKYHEYAMLAALNHSSYVNGYYQYWYNLLYQQSSSLPYYSALPPGVAGNYNYYQSCYPMAAPDCASISDGWSYDPINGMLQSCGETSTVGHWQEEDENGLEDRAREVLRNLDEVNDDLSLDQQGVDSETIITRNAVHHNEETGGEHHDEQVWRNSYGINSESLGIKTGSGEHLQTAVDDGKLGEAEFEIGNLEKSETGEVDGVNAEVVSAVVTYALENGKVDGWSMERKPALMESLVSACSIHT